MVISYDPPVMKNNWRLLRSAIRDFGVTIKNKDIKNIMQQKRGIALNLLYKLKMVRLNMSNQITYSNSILKREPLRDRTSRPYKKNARSKNRRNPKES